MSTALDITREAAPRLPGIARPDRLRVLLSKPANLYRSWPFSNDFMRHIFPVAAATYPQLAGAAAKYRPEFLDGLFERMSPTEYLDRAAKSDVVAMGVVSSMLALNTELTIQRIKAINPRCRIVLGGHHATLYADEWLRRGADYVVRGEGEEAFTTLLDRVDAGLVPRDVPGVSFRDRGENVHNPAVPLAKDLDTVPMPDWSILNWDLYNLGVSNRGRSATIETARGCPFPCTFCSVSTMWNRSQRFKSADRVLAEIESVYAQGVRQLVIGDDNFGAKPARDMVIFEEIARRGLDLSWWCFIRVDTVLRRPEFIQAAGRAGLRFAFVGYESLDDDILRQYGKDPSGRYTVADYRTVFERLRSANVFVYGLFVRHAQTRREKFRAWLSTRQVADITAQTRFIPIKGTPSAADLESRGYQVKNSFYQDRILPAYENEGRDQSSGFVLTALIDLLQPVNFYRMWRGTWMQRQFFRRLYGGMLKDLAGVTPARLRTLWTANRRGQTLDARQNSIVSSMVNRLGVKAPARVGGAGIASLWRRFDTAARYLLGREFVASPPRTVTIETTTRCTLDCPMCLRERDMAKPTEMPDDVFERVIEQIEHRAEHVVMYGLGEPLQDRSIVKRVKRASDAGLGVQISTNAMRLDREKSAELINAGLRYMIFSVDSTRDDTYRQLRPGGDLTTVVKNVRGFEVENASRGRPVHTTTQMVVLPENRGQVREFDRFWRREGTDAVRFKTDEVRAHEPGAAARHERPCPVLWRGPLYVRVDGRAHACCHHFDAPPVGDLRTQSLDEVWNGESMRRLRRLHAAGRGDEIPACRACHFQPPAKPVTAVSFLPSTDMLRRWMIRWERRKALREAPVG